MTSSFAGYRIVSDRNKEKRMVTPEAILLPSMGYRTRLDAERWRRRFEQANVGLRAVVVEGGSRCERSQEERRREGTP